MQKTKKTLTFSYNKTIVYARLLLGKTGIALLTPRATIFQRFDVSHRKEDCSKPLAALTAVRRPSLLFYHSLGFTFLTRHALNF